MRKFDRAMSVTIAAATAMFAWPAITGGAPAVVEPNTISRTTIAKSISHVSPPLAGIRLLEDIFQKMHSLPQLAMNSKMTPLLAYQNQAANSNFQQSLTDPNLTIRPRQTSRRMKTAERGITPIDDRPVVKDFREASDGSVLKQDSSRAINAPVAAAMPQSMSAGRAARFYGAPMEVPILDEEHAAAFKPMSAAVQHLYGITNQMQKAQSVADALSSANSDTAAKKVAAMRATSLARAQDKSTYRSVAISPNITEIRTESHEARTRDLTPAAAPMGAMRQDEFSAGGAGPALQGATSSTIPSPMQDQKELILDQPGIYKYMHEYAKNKAPQSKPTEIAMNAPNVVTGIPLVHLGSLASDAKSALASRYKVREQQMEGWTVCTGSKPHNSDAAIQLYLKHGMVEAMRVFDRSLLSGELGVGLGDNLQAMKSQFGEPAFIIHEPTPSASPSGQNYVYPISQVCFQLSRSGKDAPRVVSVLIFNVSETH